MAEKAKHMTEEEKKDKQYERLIHARDFHYENLNKWLTFFYVAIGAIFAGFCTLHKNPTLNPQYEVVVLAVLYLVGICAYLSCKGYYFWEKQWIMLLHSFEKQYLEGEPNNMRVYSVFANKQKLHEPYKIVGGANVSTTKVSLFLTLTITILSGAIFMYKVAKMMGCICSACEMYNIFASLMESVVITTILALIGMAAFKSELKEVDDLEL